MIDTKMPGTQEDFREEGPNDGDTERSRGRTPSRDEAVRYRGEIRTAVESVRKKKLPPRESIVWPGGLDRSLLLELPLSKRSRNSLLGSYLLEGEGPITGLELLRAPNVGRTMVVEFVRGVDEYFGECIENDTFKSR